MWFVYLCDDEEYPFGYPENDGILEDDYSENSDAEVRGDDW